MSGYFIAGMWLFFTVFSIVIFHKIFDVYYFSLVNGLIKELVFGAIAGVALMYLTLMFNTIAAIIIVIVGIGLAESKASSSGGKGVIIALFAILAISVVVVGKQVKKAGDKSKANTAKEESSSYVEDTNNVQNSIYEDSNIKVSEAPSDGTENQFATTHMPAEEIEEQMTELPIEENTEPELQEADDNYIEESDYGYLIYAGNYVRDFGFGQFDNVSLSFYTSIEPGEDCIGVCEFDGGSIRGEIYPTEYEDLFYLVTEEVGCFYASITPDSQGVMGIDLDVDDGNSSNAGYYCRTEGYHS